MTAPIIHGGAVAAAAARFGGEIGDWLDLSTGINPCPPALPDIPVTVWNRLPDSSLELAARRAALGFYLGREQLECAGQGNLPLCVPGTQAFIQILPRLAPAGRPVAILAPTYGEYAHCFARAGFAVDLVEDLDAISDRHGAVVIVNPNNPDGRVLAGAQLLDLAWKLKRQDAILHVDEAFGDAAGIDTVAGAAAAMDNLTVSRSFGKFFGLAGVRLGFVFSNTETLARITDALGPWPVSGPALYLAERLMAGGGAALAMQIAARKAGLQTVLDTAGLEVVGGTSLFALIRHDRAAALFDHLARAHILVRKFDYRADWLRLGLSPDEQGDVRLARAFSDF